MPYGGAWQALSSLARNVTGRPAKEGVATACKGDRRQGMVPTHKQERTKRCTASKTNTAYLQGNSKSKDIVQALLAILDGSAEATVARADSTDYASSSMPPASVHKQPANETLDSASTVAAAGPVQDTLLAESEDAIEAQPAAAPKADSTRLSSSQLAADVDTALQVEPAAAASNDSHVQEHPAKQATASIDLAHLKPEPEAHASQKEAAAPAASATAVDAATSGRGLTVLEPQVQSLAALSRPQSSSPDSQEADQLQPAAAAAQSPDCISNPLFEEPSAAQLVEPESIPTAPQTTASVATSESCVQQPVTAGHSTDVTAAVHTEPGPIPASSTSLPLPTTGSVATSISTATIADAVPATGTAAISQAVMQSAAAAVASQGVQRGTREPTPEDVANLGKAVSVVQARSCQLSPSLLTLQNSADMGSPANDAFERGEGKWVSKLPSLCPACIALTVTAQLEQLCQDCLHCTWGWQAACCNLLNWLKGQMCVYG